VRLPRVTRRCAIALCVVGLASLCAPQATATPSGTIEGRVLNGAADRAERDVKVILRGARPDGTARVVRRDVTDKTGRFDFKNLPTGKRVYSIDARYDGGLFAGGAVQLPADTGRRPVVRTTLRVWDTISDPNVIFIRRNNVFLSAGKQGLDVIESVTVVNTSQRAYIGRAASRGSRRPRATVGLALPSGANGSSVQVLDSSIDIPALTRTDFGVALTVALPPGQTLVTYAYRLAGSAGVYDFAKTALYPVLNTSVHAAEPISVQSNRLVSNGEVTVGGTRYKRWSTTDTLDAGDQLQVRAVAEAGSSVGLIIGIVVAALLGAGLLVWTFLRRRRTSPVVRTAGGHPVPETREHLVALIAALDLRYRAGDVTEEDWKRRRAELKEELAELQTPEPAP
jgi:hypothetical protein